METPQPTAASKEEVLGISRSGRVRKKSSKLLDFSSEDVEKKAKRGPKPGRTGTGLGRGRPPLSGIRNRKLLLETTPSSLDTTKQSNSDPHETVDELDDDFADVDAPYGNLAIADSDDDLDELVAGIVSGVVDPDSLGDPAESKVRQSLYMTEKANKRKILKDGKVITGKLERKDKGKSRYTAYSLWARESRKTSKFSKNQDLDFSNAARRLGELWANVSNKEKNAWRRKAKIQATKAKGRDKPSIVASVGYAAAAAAAATAAGAGFLNRATTSRTRKIAAERQKTPPPTPSKAVPRRSISPNASAVKRKRNNSVKSSTGTAPGMATAANFGSNHRNSNAPSSGVTAGTGSSAHSNSQVVAHSRALSAASSLANIDAIDAAAHLKLLGESLSVIGDSLKEHDGQIASSGSLSVLLDSLLCSLGPLLCLTTRLPGLDKKPQLKENLSATLDNIAYVMPGL